MYLEYGGTQIVFYLLILQSNFMGLLLSSNFQIVKKIPTAYTTSNVIIMKCVCSIFMH